MIIKICGIRYKDTLFCCEEKGVNLFGMVFYKKSPRNISIQQAGELQKLSKNLRIKGVGVFVDEDIEKVIKIIEKLDLEYVQLHGEEENEYIKKLKEKKIKIIKKISIKDKNDLNKISDYENADFLLFDYKPNKKELPGGNAKSFNWDIVKNFKINKPWFLSGGINIHNINLIKTEIDPFGIDLSSGVEKELGIKDNHIINNFMDELIDA